MHWRVGRQLLEYARHADVAGVQDHLSCQEVLGHPGRAALPESRGVCVERTRMRIDSSFQPDEAASHSPSRAAHGAQTSRIPGRRLLNICMFLVQQSS
jgi:hypothetical protein